MPVQLQQYASSIAAYRVFLYTGLSIGAVLAVIANALKKHSNFYSVAVYLSKSNGTVVVMANFGILLALLAGRLLQQIFFGPLRPMEVERLYDRMWFFVTESLLAFTIFRDEFDIPFALMFGLLLFTKCFHWLLSDRIEWMDQRPYPGPPVLFHIRIHALITLLWATDLIVFLLMVENMLSNGVGGTVLFTSEYAILLASLGNSVAKYGIALVDLRRASQRGGENAPPWEDKSMLIFYVELATDFLKLVTYLAFFMIVLTFYGLPLNIVRDVYITARSFIMRFRDLLRYRTATRNMDERYPNASEEELSAMSDRTCIICRDEMVHPTGTEAGEGTGEVHQAQAAAQPEGPNTTPKKLPCGHIFHFYCLRSWLERQQSCPTCRRSVLEGNQPARPNGQANPPPPQPGAAPQAPNGEPAPQLNWPPGQQPNRGRIMARLMGIAGMPPMGRGPGGLPNQAPQPNGNGPADQTLIDQELPPFYGQPFGPPRAQPARFPGFFAPDGVWHPWPQAPGNMNGEVPNAQQNGTPIPTPTPTIPAPSQPDSGSGQPSSSEVENLSSGGATNAQSSAREAAAAAALRRFGPSGANNVLSGSSPTSPMQSPAPGPSNLTSQPRMSSLEASGLNNNSSGSDSRQTPAPTLIPLFDPNRPSANSMSRFDSLLSLRSATRAAANAQNSNTPDRAPRFPLPQRQRELPAALTDEQLQAFDRLTREAIDERLRVLENVQAVTSRCALDLLRCRSVLPRSSPAAAADPQDTPLTTDSFTAQGSQSVSEGHENGAGPSDSQPPQPAENTT